MSKARALSVSTKVGHGVIGVVAKGKKMVKLSQRKCFNESCQNEKGSI